MKASAQDKVAYRLTVLFNNGEERSDETDDMLLDLAADFNLVIVPTTAYVEEPPFELMFVDYDEWEYAGKWGDAAERRALIISNQWRRFYR